MVIGNCEALSVQREIKSVVFNASVFRLPFFKLGGTGKTKPLLYL